MAGLEDLTLLKNAEEIADDIWRFVTKWDRFVQDTIGKQLVRAVDSIGANIAEAFGRFHYGEKINFLYYARGSIFETKYWLNRAIGRNLIDSESHQAYSATLTDIARQLNNFVNSLKRQRAAQRNTNLVKESDPTYEIADIETIFSEQDITWLSAPISNL